MQKFVGIFDTLLAKPYLLPNPTNLFKVNSGNNQSNESCYTYSKASCFYRESFRQSFPTRGRRLRRQGPGFRQRAPPPPGADLQLVVDDNDDDHDDADHQPASVAAATTAATATVGVIRPRRDQRPQEA